MTTFKVIVAGGRFFNDYTLLKSSLNKILINKENIQIVSGCVTGYNIKQFPADWDTFGKGAGYIRNKEMAGYADTCVCFWDGKSKGTKHMIDLAKKNGLPLRIIRYL